MLESYVDDNASRFTETRANSRCRVCLSILVLAAITMVSSARETGGVVSGPRNRRGGNTRAELTQKCPPGQYLKGASCRGCLSCPIGYANKGCSGEVRGWCVSCFMDGGNLKKACKDLYGGALVTDTAKLAQRYPDPAFGVFYFADEAVIHWLQQSLMCLKLVFGELNVLIGQLPYVFARRCEFNTQGSRCWRLLMSMKVRALLTSPFELTLALDADLYANPYLMHFRPPTYFLGKKLPPGRSSLLKFFPAWADIGLSPSVPHTNGRMAHLDGPYGDLKGAELPEFIYYPHVAGGFLMYTNTSASHDFFEQSLLVMKTNHIHEMGAYNEVYYSRKSRASIYLTTSRTMCLAASCVLRDFTNGLQHNESCQGRVSSFPDRLPCYFLHGPSKDDLFADSFKACGHFHAGSLWPTVTILGLDNFNADNFNAANRST